MLLDLKDCICFYIFKFLYYIILWLENTLVLHVPPIGRDNEAGSHNDSTKNIFYIPMRQKQRNIIQTIINIFSGLKL